MIELDRDRIEPARRRFEAAVRLAGEQGDPAMAGRAHARLGDVWVRLDELARARAELETALGLFPEEPEALYKLSRVLQRLGDAEGAAAARQRYREARAAAPPGPPGGRTDPPVPE